VRFETRTTGPGPIRTFAADDPALHAVGIEPLARALDHGDERDDPLADED
jgi:DNA polymerase-4